jgi:DNA-binding transcriptional LysR family regulator
MDRFSAMSAFVAVVEQGSFARAAERLDVSTSSLSRLVADLESHLGARLLNRTTRRLSLTDAGQAYYERCVQLLADLSEAEAIAGQSAAAPRGRIKLTCSVAIGLQRLAPAFASFVARYPEVHFEAVVVDRMVDLVEEGVDLAIRVGAVGSDRLVARRLGQMQLIVCAAPTYLAAHGTPQLPADLERHSLITYAYSPAPNQWRLTDGAGAVHLVKAAGALHSNSGDINVASAAAGLGIVMEPDFIVGPLLADGRLVALLPDYRGPRGDIWAVYPSRRHLSAKVRLFVEHVARHFAAAAPAPAAPG